MTQSIKQNMRKTAFLRTKPNLTTAAQIIQAYKMQVSAPAIYLESTVKFQF